MYLKNQSVLKSFIQEYLSSNKTYDTFIDHWLKSYKGGIYTELIEEEEELLEEEKETDVNLPITEKEQELSNDLKERLYGYEEAFRRALACARLTGSSCREWGKGECQSQRLVSHGRAALFRRSEQHRFGLGQPGVVAKKTHARLECGGDTYVHTCACMYIQLCTLASMHSCVLMHTPSLTPSACMSTLRAQALFRFFLHALQCAASRSSHLTARTPWGGPAKSLLPHALSTHTVPMHTTLKAKCANVR